MTTHRKSTAARIVGLHDAGRWCLRSSAGASGSPITRRRCRCRARPRHRRSTSHPRFRRGSQRCRFAKGRPSGPVRCWSRWTVRSCAPRSRKRARRRPRRRRSAIWSTSAREPKTSASPRRMWDKATASAELAAKTYQRLNALYKEGLVLAAAQRRSADQRQGRARNPRIAAKAQYDTAVTGARAQEKAGRKRDGTASRRQRRGSGRRCAGNGAQGAASSRGRQGHPSSGRTRGADSSTPPSQPFAAPEPCCAMRGSRRGATASLKAAQRCAQRRVTVRTLCTERDACATRAAGVCTRMQFAVAGVSAVRACAVT